MMLEPPRSAERCPAPLREEPGSATASLKSPCSAEDLCLVLPAWRRAARPGCRAAALRAHAPVELRSTVGSSRPRACSRYWWSRQPGQSDRGPAHARARRPQRDGGEQRRGGPQGDRQPSLRRGADGRADARDGRHRGRRAIRARGAAQLGARGRLEAGADHRDDRAREEGDHGAACRQAWTTTSPSRSARGAVRRDRAGAGSGGCRERSPATSPARTRILPTVTASPIWTGAMFMKATRWSRTRQRRVFLRDLRARSPTFTGAPPTWTRPARARSHDPRALGGGVLGAACGRSARRLDLRGGRPARADQPGLREIELLGEVLPGRSGLGRERRCGRRALNPAGNIQLKGFEAGSARRPVPLFVHIGRVVRVPA